MTMIAHKEKSNHTLFLFTLLTIPSTCVSDFSSSMKIHDETATGSMLPPSARIPIVNAVNGICHLVVELVHN
jgi:hypothetical protein